MSELKEIYDTYDRFFLTDVNNASLRIYIDRDNIFPDDYLQFVKERKLTDEIMRRIGKCTITEGRIPEAKADLMMFLDSYSAMFQKMYSFVDDEDNQNDPEKKLMYMLALINGCAKDDLYDIAFEYLEGQTAHPVNSDADKKNKPKTKQAEGGNLSVDDALRLLYDIRG